MYKERFLIFQEASRELERKHQSVSGPLGELRQEIQKTQSEILTEQLDDPVAGQKAFEKLLSDRTVGFLETETIDRVVNYAVKEGARFTLKDGAAIEKRRGNLHLLLSAMKEGNLSLRQISATALKALIWEFRQEEELGKNQEGLLSDFTERVVKMSEGRGFNPEFKKDEELMRLLLELSPDLWQLDEDHAMEMFGADQVLTRNYDTIDIIDFLSEPEDKKRYEAAEKLLKDGRKIYDLFFRAGQERDKELLPMVIRKAKDSKALEKALIKAVEILEKAGVIDALANESAKGARNISKSLAVLLDGANEYGISGLYEALLGAFRREKYKGRLERVAQLVQFNTVKADLEKIMQ